MLIEVNAFRAVHTVVFLNTSHENPTPTVWVCATPDDYERALVKLGKLKNIKIVQSGPSHVEGE